ncbi:hypothetical protein MVEN_01695900 [Mycena venus]|uniref:Uncharacterized protein n=1 Tax=Mycena venus TaxID=2733690 RepID=A0A8H7CNA9_9AGAR|nr:hypothetical protein MVEN_01695900 [Mycena venus]
MIDRAACPQAIHSASHPPQPPLLWTRTCSPPIPSPYSAPPSRSAFLILCISAVISAIVPPLVISSAYTTVPFRPLRVTVPRPFAVSFSPFIVNSFRISASSTPISLKGFSFSLPGPTDLQRRRPEPSSDPPTHSITHMKHRNGALHILTSPPSLGRARRQTGAVLGIDGFFPRGERVPLDMHTLSNLPSRYSALPSRSSSFILCISTVLPRNASLRHFIPSLYTTVPFHPPSSLRIPLDSTTRSSTSYSFPLSTRTFLIPTPPRSTPRLSPLHNFPRILRHMQYRRGFSGAPRPDHEIMPSQSSAELFSSSSAGPFTRFDNSDSILDFDDSLTLNLRIESRMA